MPVLRPLHERVAMTLVASALAVYVLLHLFVVSLIRVPLGLFTNRSSSRGSRLRPDCMNDPALGSHHFTALKNLTLHYVSRGSPSNPLMVFVHGFPECWYSWRYQLKAFSNSHRVVAVDMRGCGESDKPEGIDQYEQTHLVEDLRQLIVKLGGQNCVLVGHGIGGVTACLLAELHPELVARVAVLSSGHVKALPHPLEPRQMYNAWHLFLFTLPYLPEVYMSCHDYRMLSQWMMSHTPGSQRPPCDAQDIEAYKFAFKDGMTGPLNIIRALMRYELPTLPASKSKVPFMVVWGTKDKVWSKAVVKDSVRCSEEVTLRYLATSGHLLHMEDPAKVVGVIRTFTRRLSVVSQENLDKQQTKLLNALFDNTTME